MAGTPELWFRRTYKLPPTDPRFLDATAADILTELYAYHYDDLRREGRVEDEIEDEGFDLDDVLRDTEDDSQWETVDDDRPHPDRR